MADSKSVIYPSRAVLKKVEELGFCIGKLSIKFKLLNKKYIKKRVMEK